MAKTLHTVCNISPYRVSSEQIPQPDAGHYLITAAGTSAYLIVAVRELPQHQPWEYRYKLTCERWPVDEIPEDAILHMIYWDKRG